MSALILPGNKFILLGSRSGELMLLDLASAEIRQRVDAHKKEIWEMAMHTNPQAKGCIGQLLIATASADKMVKFWQLQHADDGIELIFHERIETTDEVMGVKFTPDGKYFVFSLLDQTMKVCYLDSMKLSLNLYGH